MEISTVTSRTAVRCNYRLTFEVFLVGDGLADVLYVKGFGSVAENSVIYLNSPTAAGTFSQIAGPTFSIGSAPATTSLDLERISVLDMNGGKTGIV